MKRVVLLLLAMSMFGGGACSATSERPGRDSDRSFAGGAPEWGKRRPVPTPRTEVTAATRSGRIYVIGGFAKEGGTVGRVEVYNVERNRWRRGG